MGARPLSTFQSEGWQRRTGGRSWHYFRVVHHPEHGETLQAVCHRAFLAPIMRAFLKPVLDKHDRPCRVCFHRHERVVLGDGWFEPAAR